MAIAGVTTGQADGPWQAVGPCYIPARMAAHAQVRTFRAAEHPNPFQLVSQGVRDIWSRRRLARYLVQADLHKHGADTLLGNIWWFLDPLLQMVVYVILVSVIFKRGGPDYPLFIFTAILPWKWFSSSINDAITSVTTRERIIKQVSFPKIVLPVASTVSGIASFAFGLVPLVGLMLAVLSGPPEPVSAAHPGHRRRSSSCSPSPAPSSCPRRTSSSATSATSPDTPSGSGSTSRRPLLGRRPEQQPGRSSSSCGSTRGPSCSSRIEPSSTTGHAPDWAPLFGLLVVSIVLFGLTTIFFKRLEPSFAKVL